MTAKIGNTEYTGLLGLILSIPIIIVTFATIAVAFLFMAGLLLSPLIFVVWLISELIK